MLETSRGVGRVVVLVLFTVLFVAAWRSDHPDRGRFNVRLSRTTVRPPTVSTVGVSAASIGEVLSFHPAARLTPADQTNGLTLHTERGVSAALRVALPMPVNDEPTKVVESAAGSLLGAQLSTVRRYSQAGHGFARDAAILGGTWNGISDRPAPTQHHVRAVGDASGGLVEVDTAGLEVSAGVGR